MKKYIPFLKHIFSTTDELIHSPDFLNRHRTNPNAFTRNRKMPFTYIIKHLLTLPQKSLSSSFDDFFNSLLPNKDISLSKQAFSKQRQLISSNAFRELFLMSTKFKSNLKQPLWHGHSLYAIDGTTLQLPNTKFNRNHFGYTQNQNDEPLAMAKVSALYNVLEDRIVDVIIDSYTSGERTQALQLINSFIPISTPKQPILIFDRGYPSREMFYSLIEKNLHFVMRYPMNSLQSVDEAPLGDHFVRDAYHNFPILLRVIKTTLPNGLQEILVTNLYDPTYTIDMFIELYFRRWPIEIKYCELKSRLYVENFTGKSPEAILQDVYATLFISNIVSIFKEVIDNEIVADHRHKNLKHEYRANRNYLIGYLIKQLLKLLKFSHKRTGLINKIIEKGKLNRSEVRPNRSPERKIKHPKAKYATSTYKHSF